MTSLEIKNLLKVKNLVFSLFDQGLYSINNFVINIFLARTISASLYGEFSVTFTIFLLIASIHSAIILEPMSIFGTSNFKNIQRHYFFNLLGVNSLLSIIFCFLIFLISKLFISHEINQVMVPMIIMSPCLLNFWFLRRYSYVIHKPQIAFLGSLVYTILLFAMVFYLLKADLFNGQTAYYTMTFSSLAAAIVLLSIFSKITTNENINKKSSFHDIFHFHFHYGKWAIGSYLLNWLSSSFFVSFIAFFIGFSAAGVFRGLQNFILPMQQFLAALSTYLLPEISYLFATRGEKAVRERTIVMLRLCLISVLTYISLLILFKSQLILLIFPKNGYLDYQWLLWFLGVAFLIDTSSQIISISLRAFKRPDAIFWPQVCSVITMVVLGSILTNLLKLEGVGITLIGISLVNLLVMVIYYKKRVIIENNHSS